MKRMKERESKHWRKDKQAGNWSDYENKRVLRREAERLAQVMFYRPTGAMEQFLAIILRTWLSW